MSHPSFASTSLSQAMRSRSSSSFRPTPLIPETAQHNEAKEEKRGKDFRYLHGAYGRGLCDCIRRKNVAHGFDPRIECGQFK
jgi:hypothetical protein